MHVKVCIWWKAFMIKTYQRFTLSCLKHLVFVGRSNCSIETKMKTTKKNPQENPADFCSYLMGSHCHENFLAFIKKSMFRDNGMEGRILFSVPTSVQCRTKCSSWPGSTSLREAGVCLCKDGPFDKSSENCVCQRGDPREGRQPSEECSFWT